jgi:hypothetical protein
MLREISQVQKDKYHMILLLWNLKKLILLKVKLCLPETGENRREGGKERKVSNEYKGTIRQEQEALQCYCKVWW